MHQPLGVRLEGFSESVSRSRGFLIERVRPDVWWYGTVLLVRGPLLTMPAIVAANVPGVSQTTSILLACRSANDRYSWHHADLSAYPSAGLATDLH